MNAFRKILEILTYEERKSGLVLLCLMVIGMVLETLGIGLFIPAISLLMQDDFAARYPVVAPIFSRLDNPSQQSIITCAMLILVGIYLIRTLYLTFLAWWQTRFAFGIQRRLSERLFVTYLAQPYTFHLQRNSAQMINNATGEVGMFTYKTLLPSMLLITEFLVLLGVGGLLLIVEPVGTIIVALVLGIASWGFHQATRGSVARWGVARQFHEGKRIQHLQQGLGGIKDVKLLGRESDFLEQYSIHNSGSAHVGERQITLQQIPRFWLELLAVTGMALLIMSMLAQGREMVHIIPTLGLFAIAAFRLMPSMTRILGAVQALRFGLPVINTLCEELSLADSIPSKISSSDDLVLQQEIRFNDVNYTYAGATQKALHGLTLNIKQGESVGFIGSSGAGKSTLVDILLGLLEPDAGEVSVDGYDIRLNMRGWQDQIGYVPQSIYLTDDTLRRNVAFGLPSELIDDAAVLRALQAAQLDEFVGGLPQGLDTVVGERGIRLSGGQRQRIGIARALYHDPQVLVLDEATSSLDMNTEREVMQAVNSLHGSKTIVIVAHRLSTVEHCDRLYRLEHGRIVAEGTPGVMLAAK
jgi:ABC-type multidrug transport system fused ATPase/permease subunit